MYGGVDSSVLSEKSVFDPKSPYAVGKVFAHEMTKVYRESYDLFCVNGILLITSPSKRRNFCHKKNNQSSRTYLSWITKILL